MGLLSIIRIFSGKLKTPVPAKPAVAARSAENFPFKGPFLLDEKSQKAVLSYLRSYSAPLRLNFLYNRREEALVLSFLPFSGRSYGQLMEDFLPGKKINIMEVCLGCLQLTQEDGGLKISFTKIAGQTLTRTEQLERDKTAIAKLIKEAS